MLRTFAPAHLEAARLAAGIRAVLDKYPSGEAIERLAAVGFAYTIFSHDDAVLGVAGIVPTGVNVGEVFVVSAEDRHAHRVEFARSVRQILKRACARFDKIRALGDDTPLLTRWFTWLGFERTGISYRPGCEGKIVWEMEGLRCR